MKKLQKDTVAWVCNPESKYYNCSVVLLNKRQKSDLFDVYIVRTCEKDTLKERELEYRDV